MHKLALAHATVHNCAQAVGRDGAYATHAFAIAPDWCSAASTKPVGTLLVTLVRSWVTCNV